MTEPQSEHFDPHRMPDWLVKDAKELMPQALGFMAAAYLAGVEVGQKSGPCGATESLYPGYPMTVCVLAFGHPGPHSTGIPYTWEDRPPVELNPAPALPPGDTPVRLSESL